MKIKCDDCLVVGAGRLLYLGRWFCQGCLRELLEAEIERSKMSEPRLRERLLTALETLREGIDINHHDHVDQALHDAVQYVGCHEAYKDMATGPGAPCENCQQLKAELECLKYEMHMRPKKEAPPGASPFLPLCREE